MIFIYNFGMNGKKKIFSEIVIFLIVESCFIGWFRTGFLTDWDSYLYTYSGLTLRPVTLASGRWLFSVLLRFVWKSTNFFISVPIADAWRVFSFATIMFAMINVVMFYFLARRLIGKDGSVVATSIFVSSPLIAISGSAVMTETYAISGFLICLLFLTSLRNFVSEDVLQDYSLTNRRVILHLLFAGVAFGFVCAIREPMIFMIFLPLGIIWNSCAQTEKAKYLFIFLGIVVFVLLINQAGAYLTCRNRSDIYANWLSGMKAERAEMSYSIIILLLRNILFLMCWLFIFSPVIVFMMSKQIRMLLVDDTETRQSGFWIRPALIAIFIYCLAEIINHSLIFNPRFVIFPGMLLAFLAGFSIVKSIRGHIKAEYIAGFIILLNGCLIFAARPVFEEYYFNKSQSAKQIYESLGTVPEKAVFIPGKFTPLIEFYKKLYNRKWKIVYSGWAFSQKRLKELLAEARKEKMPVYLVERSFFPDKRFRRKQYEALLQTEHEYRMRSSTVPHFRKIIE